MARELSGMISKGVASPSCIFFLSLIALERAKARGFCVPGKAGSGNNVLVKNPGNRVEFKVQRHSTAALTKLAVSSLSWEVGKFRLVCGGFFCGIELELEGKKKSKNLNLWAFCCCTNGSAAARYHGSV